VSHDAREPQGGADPEAAPEAPEASSVPVAHLVDPAYNRRLVRVLFAVAVGVVVLDQVTKALAVRFLEGQDPIRLIGEFLQLTFLRNPGASFGFGTSYTFIFTGIAIAVAVVIVRTSRKLGNLGWAIALGGLLGGAVGNLIDRLFRAPGFPGGYVVDFIGVPWFVFNVADAAITLSCVLMVGLALFGRELDGTRS
jgi:signal peptidase II